MSKKILRAAFATNDQQTVDAELINSKHLMMYEVTKNGCTHTATLDFAGEGGGGANNPRILALTDCALVFVAKPVIGEEALALIRSHVFVTKLDGRQHIADLLEKLQATLRDNPPPWMRKAWKTDKGGEAMSLER
ncbi:MAG: hypothetical protein AB7E77_07100 [Desulfobulbus sp.]